MADAIVNEVVIDKPLKLEAYRRDAPMTPDSKDQKWKRLNDFPDVAARVWSFQNDGYYPQPEKGVSYCFVELAHLEWPNDLNPGWKVSHAPEAYLRSASKAFPEISVSDLLVATTKQFGNVLVVPEQYVIPM